jgi:hypothetical protein
VATGFLWGDCVMKRCSEKKMASAAIFAAVGVLSGIMAGLAQGQTAYGVTGSEGRSGPSGHHWNGHPSHPIHPGNPGPGGPQPPTHPGWNEWHHPPDGREERGPAYESGWFQRPYPYHLDYYRMRYGGSYAPYFGNISGPPIIQSPMFGFGPFSPAWRGAFYW